MSDLLHAFLFEQLPVRGAIVQLETVWQTMRGLRSYPDALQSLLAQSAVAAALLASTLKRSHGSLTIQMQGDADVSLLLAECSNDYGLRATARWREGIAPAPLERMLGNGRCVITLRAQGDAGPSYQGIVPLQGSSLAQALEGYMEHSEQLATRLFLHAQPNACGGLLLQRIPGAADRDPDDWNRLQYLAATLTAQELHECSAAALLRRLFVHDDVRLFSGRALTFECSCSAQRVHGMLRALGKAEVEAVLAEQGKMEVRCEFCGRLYALSQQECHDIFSDGAGER
jgi:molecular chaperone Hsp33